MISINTSETEITQTTHLRRAVLHDLLARKIGLIANEELVDAFRGVTVDLLQPLLYVRESVYPSSRFRAEPIAYTLRHTVIGHVIYYNDTVCATVVRGCDSSETFLACNIGL